MLAPNDDTPAAVSLSVATPLLVSAIIHLFPPNSEESFLCFSFFLPEGNRCNNLFPVWHIRA